jgi:hypothetical protein
MASEEHDQPNHGETTRIPDDVQASECPAQPMGSPAYNHPSPCQNSPLPAQSMAILAVKQTTLWPFQIMASPTNV